MSRTTTDRFILAAVPNTFPALIQALPWLHTGSLRQRLEHLLDSGVITLDAGVFAQKAGR
jgi:hypothetical protein